MCWCAAPPRSSLWISRRINVQIFKPAGQAGETTGRRTRRAAPTENANQLATEGDVGGRERRNVTVSVMMRKEAKCKETPPPDSSFPTPNERRAASELQLDLPFALLRNRGVTLSHFLNLFTSFLPKLWFSSHFSVTGISMPPIPAP